MSIVPIGNIQSIVKQIQPVAQETDQSTVSFTDVIKNALENANQAEKTVKQDGILVATGQTDDLHTAMIDSAKAELAVAMLVQVRNKALEAYNNIINMSV